MVIIHLSLVVMFLAGPQFPPKHQAVFHHQITALKIMPFEPLPEYYPPPNPDELLPIDPPLDEQPAQDDDEEDSASLPQSHHPMALTLFDVFIQTGYGEARQISAFSPLSGGGRCRR